MLFLLSTHAVSMSVSGLSFRPIPLAMNLIKAGGRLATQKHNWGHTSLQGISGAKLGEGPAHQLCSCLLCVCFCVCVSTRACGCENGTQGLCMLGKCATNIPLASFFNFKAGLLNPEVTVLGAAPRRLLVQGQPLPTGRWQCPPSVLKDHSCLQTLARASAGRVPSASKQLL